MGDWLQLGPQGEAHAAKLLEQRGHRILERNYRCPQGELDLITWHRHTLVFVEVRVRQKSPDHHPLETITEQKQKRIGRAAQWFLVKNWKKAPPDCRFDVIWLQAQGSEIADGGVLEGAFRV